MEEPASRRGKPSLCPAPWQCRRLPGGSGRLVRCWPRWSSSTRSRATPRPTGPGPLRSSNAQRKRAHILSSCPSSSPPARLAPNLAPNRRRPAVAALTDREVVVLGSGRGLTLSDNSPTGVIEVGSRGGLLGSRRLAMKARHLAMTGMALRKSVAVSPALTLWGWLGSFNRLTPPVSGAPAAGTRPRWRRFAATTPKTVAGQRARRTFRERSCGAWCWRPCTG